MTRAHSGWGSLRRTGRQLALLVVFGGIGLIAVVVMLLLSGAGE